MRPRAGAPPRPDPRSRPMAQHKSSDPNVFILPDLGEGVHEGELVKWRVAVGDAVEEGQPLADLETDKALAEVCSPRAGVVAAVHGKEGEILKVGNPFVTFVGQGAAEGKPAAERDAACDVGGQIASHLPGQGQGHSNGTRPGPEAAQREDAGTVVGAVGGELAGVSSAGGKALATPAVRRLARDLGVEIDAIAGTGIGGRVTEKDVRGAASGSGGRGGAAADAPRSTPAARHPAPAALRREEARRDDTAVARAAAAPAAKAAPRVPETPAIPPGADVLRVPVRGVRRTIAGRLRESVDRAVHFTVMDEADVTALDAVRRRLGAASGEKLSLLPFVAAAVTRALTGRFGALNATSDIDPQTGEGEIARHRAVHLGIATDTDNGLMVPVIRDADGLGVLEIARQIAHVAESARDRTAPREMLVGSTFTISNVGSHAGRFATPVINYPEVAILAVGRAREGVVVRDGMLGVGRLLPLSLACDHRVVDGATAALRWPA
ncbi:MAG: 2-oxo acid dehydrogenase subunit E2 [Isosphaera sp.]|nr:2-oxo acid dehydrogenase subunit E2 [Isosphaera sp.]